MKGKIRKDCYRQVRTALETELNAKNKLDTINTLAILVLTYSFNIINRNLEEIRRMYRKIRKLLTWNRMHHPKVNVNRMYFPKREGERGIINLKMCFKATTIGLNSYSESSDDWMLHIVLLHEKKRKLHSIVKESRMIKFFQLHLALEENEPNLTATKTATEIKQKVKQASQEDM